MSHIASSYFISGFTEAAGVSVDGSGDFTTTSNSLCKDQSISMHDRIFYPHSLGVFYSAITNFLGFENYGEEYKVMGLAPYGEDKYRDIMTDLVTMDENSWFRLGPGYL